MSRSSDVLIVGGGVVGLTLARWLAISGRSITLIDKGVCGQEASWAGAGILSPCNPHRQDVLFQLRERSLSLYEDFCIALHDESGIDPEYERCGELELLFTEQRLRQARADEKVATGRRLPGGELALSILSRDEACSLVPMLTDEILGALHWRQSAQIRNPRMLAALKRACERAGVMIREFTAAMDFIETGGRIDGVVTQTGTILAETTVLCAGAWSSTIGRRLETTMPVHPVRGQMVLLKVDRRPFGPVVSHGKHYVVARRDGHVLVGATEEHDAGFVKRNTANGIAGLTQATIRMLPGLADVPIAATWAGLRPGTPDDRPYLGHVPGYEGLIAATGHFRAGLTLAPVTAEIVMAILDGGDAGVDLSSLAPGRLTEPRPERTV